MEFVTLVLAAEEGEYPDIGESSGPLEQWSGIEAPGLDTVKIATLHSLMTGDSLQDSLDLYEPIYVSESDTIVLRIADGFLERLASIEEEGLESVASELVATEEFEREQWDPEDVLTQLTALAELAQLAESQGQLLFVWMYFVER